jgi:FUN14 domain-containing protein 1
MLPLRVGANLTSTFARGTAARRVGHQLARRGYATTAPVRRPNLLLYAGLAGAGIGLHAYSLNNVYCDKSASPQASPAAATPPPAQEGSDLPSPPASALNLYELTFGSVCGICAGVFIKKGAKFVAFILGGTFVLLQYLGSLSVVRVDWSRTATRFENLFYRTENGVRRPPTITSLWSWLVNFLTADFQPRATFAAGLILGLRIG